MSACALLVEDDPDDLLLLGRALHRLGVDVVSAGTAAHARELLVARVLEQPDRPYSIAFVDMKLVGSQGDGADVVRMMRETAPLVPVIIVTGYEYPGALSPIWSLRYVSLAFKPIEEVTLLMILEHHHIETCRGVRDLVPII